MEPGKPANGTACAEGAGKANAAHGVSVASRVDKYGALASSSKGMGLAPPDLGWAIATSKGSVPAAEARRDVEVVAWRAALPEDLAGGLAGLAASGLSRAAKYAELLRSYSELQASREVLARSQKLRALGEMAAGVSHDLKTILNPPSLNLQFLRRPVPRHPKQAPA